MNSLARTLHQTAMDLYDLGRIYKAKGQPEFYVGHLDLACFLDKEAAIRIQNEDTDNLWRAVYPRSAGWLAYKNGKYVEAKELAELGLKHRDYTDSYEISKLEELLKAANEKLEELGLEPQKKASNLHLSGTVASANLDEKQLQIRPNGDKKYHTVQVAKEKILNIARLYIGEVVEIEAKKEENGVMVLESIRRAA